MTKRQVEPDEVREGKRPHGMVHPQGHDLVHRLRRGDTFGNGEDRLVDHGHEKPVGDESRVVGALDGSLAHGAGDVIGRIDCLGRGVEAADHFNQPHHRHRIHEVHADHAARARGGCAEAGDGDRGGVGGKNGRIGAGLVQLAKYLGFDVQSFFGGLHHHLGGGVVLDSVADGDPTENAVAIGRLDRPAANLAVDVARNRRQSLVEDIGVDVGENDVESGQRRHMGDAATHLTGPDHADGSNFHEASTFRSRLLARPGPAVFSDGPLCHQAETAQPRRSQ